MDGPVWKRINVVGPQAVNGLNVPGYGRSGPEKSWTVPSLPFCIQITQQHNSLKTETTPKLATAFRYLIYKRSTFLRHKVICVLPNATVLCTVMVIITLETILNEKVGNHFYCVNCDPIILAVNFWLNTKPENNNNEHVGALIYHALTTDLCTKPVGDEYLCTNVQWKCHLIQDKPTFTNYAQPQHGGNAGKNCKFIAAGNRLSTFCVFLSDPHPE